MRWRRFERDWEEASRSGRRDARRGVRAIWGGRGAQIWVISGVPFMGGLAGCSHEGYMREWSEVCEREGNGSTTRVMSSGHSMCY